ncbi:cytochrome P450 [Gymnopilus junonius]|uniref:Cytochrome P450 n=1 Tax=Gymnopilus junonius TaxID=109634 RepID=A0A9P5TKW8_GYMJU|nr:cytochrome P450 [Gymnopilus junonius]
MYNSMSTYALVAALVPFLYFIKVLVKKLSTHPRNVAPYPPGPKPKPFVGNMFDLPTKKAAQTYLQWGQMYKSNILHTSSLGNHLVILNKFEDADELFERRARKYSDRAQLPIAKLMGWESSTGLLPYGAEWRLHRRIFQKSFRAEAIRDYHPLLRKKVHHFLRDLLKAPESFDDHKLLLTSSVPMMTTYGYDVKSLDDPLVTAAHASMEITTSLLLPGATFINTLPVLAHLPTWFPGASSRKMAATVHDLTEKLDSTLFEFVKGRMLKGRQIPSFISDFLLTGHGASTEEKNAVRTVANSIFSAASDTTLSSIGAFFYVMAINPDVQRRAQAEIAKVIGASRLPVFEDRSSLPYIEALYKELLRSHPPVQLGLPHMVSEDDLYKGYFLPKGTEVLPNIWAMTHDEERYPEPFKFKPERFFDEEGNLNSDDRILAYGFGRRVCAGKYMASSLLWLTIASVLACFNIEKAKDEFGNDIDINDDFDEFGLLVHKTSFKCSIVPRSEIARRLLTEDAST